MAGLTQTELARLAGIDNTTISDLERGKILRPSHDLVTRVVRALRGSGLKGITNEQLFPVPDEHAEVA